MADGTALNKAVVTQITDEVTGAITGYTSVYTETGRRFTVEYDENFNVVNETVEELYTNLKGIDDEALPDAIRSGFADAVSLLGTDDTDSANYGFVLKNNNQTIQIIWFAEDGDGSGELIGRVNIWEDTNTWDSWQGSVTNKHVGYDLHDASWNYLASSNETERSVTFENDSGQQVTYVDETQSSVHYNQRKPSDAAELTAWDELDPGSSAIDWDSVDVVRSSENTWTNYATPAGAINTRDTDVTSTELRHEFFNEVEFLADDGTTVLWTDQQFMGAWQLRDGFVEIYDENWNLVSRELAPGAGYSYDELLEIIAEAEGQSAADAFGTAWGEIQEYLPDGAGDTNTKFTLNEWGEIFVFGGEQNQLMLRINAGSHENIWEESWDQNFGYAKWENAWFDVQDADWMQIAHLSQWTRSKTTTEQYLDTPDDETIWVADETGTNSSIRVYETDVPKQWDILFKDTYGLPDAVQDVEGIWAWGDVTSISIGNETQTWFAIDGYRSEDSSRESSRVEYFGEYTHLNEDGSESWTDTNYFLGSVQKRDGFIEVHDRNWNLLGRFVDPDQALEFGEVAAQIEGFSAAWVELGESLPEGWDADTSSFAIDQWDRIQVFDAAGKLVGRIGSWDGENSWTNWRGDTVENQWYGFNFHDADWDHIGSVHGDERYVTDGESGIRYHDESHMRVDFSIDKPSDSATDLEKTAWSELDPKTSSINWDDVDVVRAGESNWTQYETPDGVENIREEEVSNTEARREFFKFEERLDGEGNVMWTDEIFMGSWQQRDGFVEIYDENWQLVSRELAPGAGLTYAELLAEIEARHDAETAQTFDDAMKVNADALSSKLGIDFTSQDDLLATMGIVIPENTEDLSTIRFTINEWDNVFIFDGSGELAVRVNWNTYIEFWEEPWDQEYGWTKWENSWFDFQDEDWDQIVNTNTWERSKATRDDYDEATDPATASIWVPDETGTNTNVRIYKADVTETLWDTFFKSEYDLPDVVTGLDWDWDDVNSVSIGTETQTWHVMPDRRDEESSRDSERVEYFGTYTEYNEDGSVRWTNDNERLGTVQKRDGYIEVHDRHWNLVGKFMDPEFALDFSDVVVDTTGFALAWANIASAMPVEWISSEVQASMKTILDDLPSIGVEAAEAGIAAIMDASNVRFAMDQWDNIQVFVGGSSVGEIHSWSGNNDWTNWRGDLVENSWYGYNFYNISINQNGHNDWDNIGTIHGDERYVTEEESGIRYHDESHMQVTFKIEEPGLGASQGEIDAWDALNPNVSQILWSEVDMVRAGDSEWTYYKTPEGVQNDRSEDESNSEERREFFKFEDRLDGDGNIMWTEEIFMGSWQQRDGFVEIYDENWQLVSRELAPGLGLTYAELLDAIERGDGVEARDAFDSAVQNNAEYLSGIDETDTRFTRSEWGEIYQFNASGELVFRINWNTHVDVEETPWDHHYDYRKWENSWFDVQDADWNQIVNFSQWSRDVATEEQYAAGTWIDDEEGAQTSIRVYKDDLGELVWDGYFKTNYDVPDAVTGLDWDWTDVNSISIGTETQTWYVLAEHRDEESSRDSERIEYFGEYTEYDEDGNELWTNENERLGTIQKRDGYIEVHDRHWNLVGKFMDPEFALDFSEVVSDTTGFALAWANMASGMPVEWISSDVQASMQTILGDLPTIGVEAAEAGIAAIMDASNVRFAMDQWDNIQVFVDGASVGEIHSWNGSDNWTNWRGDLVENSWYGFNFNNVTINEYGHNDWDHIGSVHGGERYVTEDDSEVKYHDESHIRIDFSIEKPESSDPQSALDAWDALNPNVEQIDWNLVDVVRAGNNTWTQYVIPAEADNERSEQIDNTEERREFFSKFEHKDDNGNVMWTEEIFLGSWQERDGFVEIYDENWNLLSRELGDGAGYSYAELLALIESEEGTLARDTFDTAWTRIEKFLPKGADEATAKFTVNEWGQIFVFDTGGELLVRINADMHEDVHERPWDDTFGWQKWENAWFDVQDADFNQIAHISEWTNSIARTTDYENDPDDPTIWIKDTVGQNENIRVYKEDVSSVWDTLFKTDYDLDANLATALEQHYQSNGDDGWTFNWDNITSISIGTNQNTREQIIGWRDEEETETSERIEYHVDGQRIAIVEKRNGVFELRDGDWNWIGEFLDPDATNALTYSELIADTPVYDDAFLALEDYLPVSKDEIVNYIFVKTSDRDYQVYDENGDFVMKSHVNVNISSPDDQGRVHENFYINFNDDNWNEYGSYHGWKDTNTDGTLTEEEAVTTRVRVDVTDLNRDKLEADGFAPIESQKATDAGIVWSVIDQVSIGERVDTQYDTSGNSRSETTSEFEYFTYEDQYNYYEFIGAQTQRGALITLVDENWDFVDSAIDEGAEGVTGLSWFGPLTEPVIGFAADQFEEEIFDLTGFGTDVYPVQVDDKSGYIEDINGNVVGTIEVEYHLNNGGSEIYWELHITPLEGPGEGMTFSLEGEQAYDPDSGQMIVDSDGRAHVKLVWPQIGVKDLSDEEIAQLKQDFGPQGDAADLVDWSNLSYIKYREWRNYEDVDLLNGDGGTFTESEGQVRFIQRDEFGRDIWDNDQVIHIHIRGAFEFVSIGREDAYSVAVNRYLPDQSEAAFDKLGPETDAILTNWLTAVEADVLAALNEDPTVSIQSIDDLQIVEIGDSGSGWVKDKSGQNIALFVGNVDAGPDEWGNVGWDFEVYDMKGNALFEGWGHNEPLESGDGLSSSGHYGVYFRYPEMRFTDYEANEWDQLVADHAPTKELEEFVAEDVGVIRTERILKFNDGRASRDEIRTKFFVKDEFGDIVWDWSNPLNIEITESGGIERYFAGEDEAENFLGFALKDGAQLSEITDPIDGVDWFLTKWIETMSPEVLGVHGVDISGHKFRTTDEGGIVLVDSLDNVVGISTRSDINPDDYWTNGDVKYAWVGINVAMESGEEIVVQGNIALDPNGDVLQDTANFMLRPFDEQSWDYDSESEWNAIVDKLLSDYPELANVLSAQGLTADWIERVHSSIDRADYDRGDGTFAITDARERLDIMNGNDWNQPGHIRIEISDVGYQIYIRDEFGDNQLVGGEQTAPITDNGPANAAFGANTNQLIENWFELFDTQIMESFMDYSLPEDGTLSDSIMETPMLPDLASLTITDVDVNGQAETVIINSDGEAVFIFNDSWIDRDNEYSDGVWWGGQLNHVGSGFSIQLNGKAPTDTKDPTGVLLADSGFMRFQYIDKRVDDFETKEEYAKGFEDFVYNLGGLESSVDPMVHGRVQMAQRVTFETVDGALNKLSDYTQVDFLAYDPETRNTDWDSPDNVYGQNHEPLIVELNSDWNVTAIRMSEYDYIAPSTFADTLGAVNSDLAAVADMSDSFITALNGYKFANLGLGVIGVYDPADDDLEAVIFDRGWDNQQAWDIFDINTQEWTGRIRSGERNTGDFEQVWVEADLSDPSLLELAGPIGGIHGLTEEDFPYVAKLMVVEHFVPETGAHYLGFVGYDDDGEYVIDLGVSNNYRSPDLPDQTGPEPATGVYSAGYKLAGSAWEALPVPDDMDGQLLMDNIEAYMDKRTTEQLVESYDSGATVIYEAGVSLDYSVFAKDGATETGGFVDLSDPEAMYDIFSEKPDIGVADAGSVEAVMHDMLMNGDTDKSDADVTLSDGNGLFDVTIKGTTNIDDAVQAMEDIAMIVFNEDLDLTLDEYPSTEV